MNRVLRKVGRPLHDGRPPDRFFRKQRPYWAVFGLAFALIFYRMPDRLFNGFLWAEDAHVFLAGAYTRGWHGLLVPYAGYLLTLPRTLAIAASKTLDLHTIPFALPWACALIVAVSTTYIYAVAQAIRWQSGRPPQIWALLIAIAPLLVPSGGEVFLNITNLQWVLCPALIALIWEIFFGGEESMGFVGAGVRALCLVLLSTTGPFGAILWPLACTAAVLRPEVRRSRSARAIFILYTAAALLQALTVAFADRPSKDPLHDLPWMHDFLVHVISEMYVPADVLQFVGYPQLLGVLLLGGILFVIVTNRRRYTCLVLGGFGVAMWISAMAWVNLPGVPFSWEGACTRYLYLPALMMAWALLVSSASTTSNLVKSLSTGLLLMMLMTSAGRFRADRFPSWAIEQSAQGTTLSVPPGPAWNLVIPKK